MAHALETLERFVFEFVNLQQLVDETSALQVLVRCNNVLYIRAAEDEMEEGG